MVGTKVRTGLAHLVEPIDEFLTVAQVLLDLPVTDQEWSTLSSQQHAARIKEGVKNLLLQAADSNPVILVFEDLHWIDTASQKVIDALVEGLSSHTLLLVVTHRPEYQHDWGTKSYYTRIRIDPLTESSSHEMLDKLIGTGTDLESLKHLLISRTEGRPLFIEETVRSLQETGVLSVDEGGARVERDPESIDIPASVQDVLAARIDRLASDLKSLLQRAAVIGRRVPVHLLQAMEALPDETLHEQLTALQSSEFLYETTAGDDAAYIFKHALTEEVAYASLTRDTRRQLHSRLVDAIESAYAGRLDEHVEELGRHALRAERWVDAFRYNREAAKKAHARSAYPAAIERFEDALTALDHLPDDDETYQVDKMDIRLEMRTALWPLGRHDELARRVREAGELAERAGDTARLANVHNYLTAHHWRAGEHALAIDHGETGIDLAERAGDFSVLYTTLQHLGIAYNARGEFERQVEVHRRVTEALTGPPAYRRHGMAGYPAAITRGFLAWGLAELGAFDEALDWARQGVEIAGEVNSAMSTVWSTDYLALTFLLRGEKTQAISLLEPNLDLCERAEVRLLGTITHGILGLALSAAGRHEDAIVLLEDAVKPEFLDHHPQGSGYPFVWLARTHLDMGQLQDARNAVVRAVNLARQLREGGHEAWARFTQAEIERASGSSLSKVTSAYERALQMADARAMRPLAARCRLGLALSVTGESAEGDSLLKQARNAFSDMGMIYWVDQATKPSL